MCFSSVNIGSLLEPDSSGSTGRSCWKPESPGFSAVLVPRLDWCIWRINVHFFYKLKSDFIFSHLFWTKLVCVFFFPAAAEAPGLIKYLHLVSGSCYCSKHQAFLQILFHNETHYSSKHDDHFKPQQHTCMVSQLSDSNCKCCFILKVQSLMNFYLKENKYFTKTTSVQYHVWIYVMHSYWISVQHLIMWTMICYLSKRRTGSDFMVQCWISWNLTQRTEITLR